MTLIKDEVKVRPRNIIVVELDSTMPRRDPNKPHLYITNTVAEPEKRFKQLLNGKGPNFSKGTYSALRQDLNPFDSPALTESEAKQRLAELKLALTQQGYAINGDNRIWHGYVIDLIPPEGMTNVGKGYVYVGQTSLTPEERFAVHKAPRPDPPAKDLRSKVVNKRGLCLNYELMTQLTPHSPVYRQQDVIGEH